ncbi:Fic/DOC family protein [Kocuria rosea]|uniref:Fic/DOC family protein n=1 Tax=Kocuria rosea TaxID=1275 RepID=UPI0011A2C38C|nr:Fic family protein [Kocuria rosea]
MSEAPGPHHDPYLDPHTGILTNLIGARTAVELAAAEADLVAVRTLQLWRHPPAPTRDLVELQAIHRHLFQDVYPWAGQLRTVDLRKTVPGAQPFLPVSMITRSAGFVFDQLRQDRYLQHLDRDRFIERLAYHYDQVNYLHPFREGNGRTQRFFFDRLAVAAGWWLDWTQITGAVNDAASRAAAEDHDLAALQEMFAVILTTVGRVPDRTS